MAYASKYYDPVKAHEYYEKHKKLKGRQSTKGMTNSQKEMAAYVKDKLSAEKKQKLESVTKKAQSRCYRCCQGKKRNVCEVMFQYNYQSQN